MKSFFQKTLILKCQKIIINYLIGALKTKTYFGAVKAFKKKKEKTIKEKILRTVIIAGIIIVIVAGIYFALIN